MYSCCELDRVPCSVKSNSSKLCVPFLPFFCHVIISWSNVKVSKYACECKFAVSENGVVAYTGFSIFFEVCVNDFSLFDEVVIELMIECEEVLEVYSPYGVKKFKYES